MECTIYLLGNNYHIVLFFPLICPRTGVELHLCSNIVISKIDTLLFTLHFIVMASVTGSTSSPITPGTGDVEGMHIVLSTIVFDISDLVLVL